MTNAALIYHEVESPGLNSSVDSSEQSYPGVRAADRLKDHDSGRWLSGNANSTHYDQMDWSSQQAKNVKVWSGNPPGGGKGAQIDDFTIEYWDGTSWVNAATVVNNSKDGVLGRYNDLYFPPVTTSKLRMNITGPSRFDHTARVIEIEVYGDSTEASDDEDENGKGNGNGNGRQLFMVARDFFCVLCRWRFEETRLTKS